MKNHCSFWLLAVLGAAALPSCHAKTMLPEMGGEIGFPVQTVPEKPAPVPVSPFQITARASATEFEAGKPIPLEIEITNTSKTAVDLNFKSGQSFDFSAKREGDDNFVWSYGMNKRFMQSLRTVALEAGKSLHFKTVWRGAPAGVYTVSAKITANGGLEAAPFQIVVK